MELEAQKLEVPFINPVNMENNMSFFSSVIIGMLEKELAAQTPEIEAYVLQTVGSIGQSLMGYVAQKAAGSSVTPVVTPQAVE